MSKTRSPNYPIVDAADAIDAVANVFKKEIRNKMSRQVLAKHLGYGSLNGRSLGMIGALRAYGLIEGSGDEVRVSEDAVTILNAPHGSQDRRAAIERCALRPALFQDIKTAFENTPSPENLRYELIKRGFTPDAAGKASQSYLSSISLVNGVGGGYNRQNNEGSSADVPDRETPEVGDLVQIEIGGAFQLEKPKRLRAIQEHDGQEWAFIEGTETGFPMDQVIVDQKGAGGAGSGGGLPPRLREERSPPPIGIKEEKNSLDEGEAILTWPENLSAESVLDLEYWLKGILNKAKRRAGIPDGKSKTVDVEDPKPN